MSNQQKAMKVLENIGYPGMDLIEIGRGYFISWISWTPETAAHVLEKFNTDNRKLKPTKIEQMKDDMEKGNWLPCHQGIAFGLDGKLKDGQNRLSAVVRSNTTQVILTVIGVNDEVKQVIDQGVSRTTLDVAKFMGIKDAQLNRRLTLAKAIEAGMRSHNISCSNQIAISYLRPYKNAINFVLEQFPKKVPAITSAPVLAVVARAYMWCKRKKDERALKRLIQFCAILRTGDWKSVPSNEIVRKLRDNFLLHKYAGGSEKAKQYAMTEHVVYHYINRLSTERLKQAKEEYFPLKREENVPKPSII